MSQKVTLGGDRVGSGKKMQAELHDYYRSTHNLSEKFASSIAPGVLYPSLCKLAMRGDTFEIDINQDARTIPTRGALFGSFKYQTDVFFCPARLYQAILHNNPLAIGLKMNQVLFPVTEIQVTGFKGGSYDVNDGKLNESSLLKYLGLSGIGRGNAGSNPRNFKRTINAIPVLAYYDIFKNYYSNKQEENAYVIKTTETIEENTTINKINVWTGTNDKFQGSYANSVEIPIPTNPYITLNIEILGTGLNTDIVLGIKDIENNTETTTLLEQLDNGTIVASEISNSRISFRTFVNNINQMSYNWGFKEVRFIKIEAEGGTLTATSQLEPFPLSNIDDMRYDILSHHTLGSRFNIADSSAQMPYAAVYEKLNNGKSQSQYPMAGLVVKTYQNDIFNNWLNTEWIEGENGINELTKVAVTDGAFSMDALNFATKLYNMLNRVAVAGGTYEDWQDVVYEEVKRRQIESPIYCGGTSQEIMFDEIVQTTPAEGEPLGNLGGRGRLVGNRKGGHINIKCDEAGFIIAITSITPRLFYTQGNEFYLTDVFSMDDIHKPALDGIGFQDLIGERMAWFDTVLNVSEAAKEVEFRSKIGKIPAWLEYMTSVDKAYGDFAMNGGRGYMILNRNYEYKTGGGILDATTYIDPRKYNYAFANTELTAQNFWLEIEFKIKARRLMSARIIPNV